MTKKHGPNPGDPTQPGRWFAKSLRTRRKQTKEARKARRANR